MHRHGPFVPLLVLAGCLAPPNRPPFACESTEGVVYGASKETAQEIAGIAGPISGQVRAVVGVDRDDPWELWLIEERAPWLPEHDGAGHLVEWVVRAGPMSWSRDLLMAHGEPAWSSRYILAHEIAHWHTRSWKLPRVLLEGVADWVAGQVATEVAPELTEYRSIALAMIRDDLSPLADLAPLDVTDADWEAGTTEALRALYSYGSLVVEHLGLDGVHRLSGASRDTLREAVAEALEHALRAAPVPTADTPQNAGRDSGRVAPKVGQGRKE